MYTSSNQAGERGFSLYECVIALSVMMILGGAVISLSQGALKVATTTYELSDAQSGVRAAQEYINRDLMNAGDGLNSINNIKIRSGFVTNYLSKNNSIDYNNFGILTSDNDVPINTTVLGTSPSLTVRSSPSLTDRITILANDSTFVTYTPQSSNNLGDFITIASTDVGLFTAGEVYYITAGGGSTFGQITSISGTGLTRQLNFANGDTLGLNLVRTSSLLRLHRPNKLHYQRRRQPSSMLRMDDSLT
jgi:type II secretory pathway pseudopilin PulG